MSKKVAIIMINYKYYAERFLKESYESLLKVNYPEADWQLYVADNVTSPETAALCKELAPKAKVIPSDGNGWGHANNYCARQALKDGFGDYIFLVNMDTEFDPEFINEAIKVYESDPAIGAVQSKLLLHPPVDGEYMLNSKGNSLTFLGFGYCAGDGKKDDTTDEVVDVTYGAGAGLLIAGKLFEEVGMCDESYFMYHDDTEISLKLKIMGKRVVLAPRSVIYHKHEFGRSIMQINFMERNRFRILLEFYKWRTLALIFPAWLFMEIGMMPYALVNHWIGTKFKVYAWFLNPKNMAMVMNKRAQVQKMRQVGDKQLLKGVTAKVDFQQVDNPLLKYVANPIFTAYWAIISGFVK